MMDLILLFITGLLASIISGVAGFGGALILLPLVTAFIGIKEAIPVLTIAQIFGNASRAWFGRTELKWRPVIYFLITAVPLSILGSYLFTKSTGTKIQTFVGIFLILMVAIRRIQRRKIKIGNKTMLIGGGLTGFISGIAGSAGPLGAAFFLGLNLTATAYVASEAFTALSMHLVKSFIYNKYSLLSFSQLYYGVFVGIAMILGSWTGRKIIQRLPEKAFSFLVEILLIISGIILVLN